MDDNLSKDRENESKGISRRDIVKGLATVPVLGGVLYGAYRKLKHDRILRSNILSRIGVNTESEKSTPEAAVDRSKQIRLGIIGFGIRGTQLTRAAGFATEEWLQTEKDRAEKTGNNTALQTFLDQDDLNIVVNGVCDIFTVRNDLAQKTVSNDKHQAKKYHNWEDLVHADDIDAVIIAAPDHWHAPMAMEAARSGKHVYVEKPMTHRVQETYDLYDLVKKTGIKLQLGHQRRETESYNKARDLIRKDALGKVTLIQNNTNRNSPNGAWQYTIDPAASPETIDWERFLGNAPQIPFNKDRFFRWRKYWDYGTGLSGDLMTHEFDAINQIFGMGIPKSLSASGGIYYWKDGREVPDVFNVLFEYPDQDFTFQYSATLGNEFNRPNLIMGHDATMELGNTITLYPDRRSTRYEKYIKNGTIDLEMPMYSYTSGSGNVDAITSATERYFAEKGMLYSYFNGKLIDVTHLHIANWLDCIRGGGEPSCNVDAGFQESISAHMGTLSLKLGKRVEWDHEKNFFANISWDEIKQTMGG